MRDVSRHKSMDVLQSYVRDAALFRDLAPVKEGDNLLFTKTIVVTPLRSAKDPRATARQA
jgi:hypothetical protein